MHFVKDVFSVLVTFVKTWEITASHALSTWVKVPNLG